MRFIINFSLEFNEFDWNFYKIVKLFSFGTVYRVKVPFGSCSRQMNTEVFIVIVYDVFFDTLKKKGMTQYKLIKDYKVSHGLLDRMRKNKDISIYSVNMLCSILQCSVEDICRYVPDKTSL